MTGDKQRTTDDTTDDTQWTMDDVRRTTDYMRWTATNSGVSMLNAHKESTVTAVCSVFTSHRSRSRLFSFCHLIGHPSVSHEEAALLSARCIRGINEARGLQIACLSGEGGYGGGGRGRRAGTMYVPSRGPHSPLPASTALPSGMTGNSQSFQTDSSDAEWRTD